MSGSETCQNCNSKSTGSLKIALVNNQRYIDFLNLVLNKDAKTYCNKCVVDAGNLANDLIKDKNNTYAQMLTDVALSIPMVSIYAPPKWDFEVIGLVTGQSTTGTGVLNEVYSAFTDIFGRQSKSTNSKLKLGENLCLAQIGYQTLELGGNAVVGIDIDYSEVGGDKGMLMVCMTGTAVKLNNIDGMFKKASEKINPLDKLRNELLVIEELQQNVGDTSLASICGIAAPTFMQW